MPQTCVVQGCTNRSNKAGCEGVSFHHLPLSNAPLLRLWVLKARIPEKLVNKTSRLCSNHFIGGKRRHLYDVPELFPWTPTNRKIPAPRKIPSTSTMEPSQSPLVSPSLPSSSLSSLPTSSLSPPLFSSPILSLPSAVEIINHDHTYCSNSTEKSNCLSSIPSDSTVSLLSSTSCTMDISVQCSLGEKAFRVSDVCGNKNAIHFYTGLPDYETFMACFEFLGESVNQLQYWYGGKSRPQSALLELLHLLMNFSWSCADFVLDCWNKIWHTDFKYHSLQCHEYA